MRRHALITGATKGIGKAVVTRLLERDFNIILTYSHDHERARALRDELHARYSSDRVVLLNADCADISAIDTMTSCITDLGIKLDALILNVGLTDRSEFEQIELEVWRQIIDANVTIPVFTVQRLLPHLRNDASIVFTGSLMGLRPHATSLAYGVTKSCVHALATNLVKFVSARGIRVNAVAPGFVDTEWQLGKPTEIRARIESKIALSRFAHPDEISEAYLFLIENSYINGQVLTIDGGYDFR